MTKTKTKIIIILAAILGGVFAFTTGSVWCAYSHSMNISNNQKAMNTYIAKQSYAIINDTKISPIPFGAGAHNYSVGLELSYSYDVDIRVRYSLVWSNGKPTDNVILNFADRDNLIVDNQYIYRVETIPAGNHTINFITGVDFVDVYDNSYFGATLVINLDEVKVYKSTNTYDTNHILCRGVSSPARDMWLRAKNSRDYTNAYVMMYNNRAYMSTGIKHPGDITAYSKSLNAEYEITNMTRLYGNTSYAGIGMYIITGNESYTLSARVVGRWQKNDGDDSSTGGVVFDNNIKINYSQDWSSESSGVDADYGAFRYEYTIGANTCAYIPLADSIEITLRNTLEQTDYSSYTLVVSSISLNGTIFSNFVDGIQVQEINKISVATSKTYTKQDITITNTTKYKADLFDSGRHEANAQSYITNVNITNNTDKNIKVTAVTFKLKYYRSNGQSTQFVSSGDLSNYGFDSVYWYRETVVLDGSVLGINSKMPIIAPYSSANLLEDYTVYALLKNNIGNYDVWIELVVDVTTEVSTGENVGLDIQPTYINNNNTANVTFTLNNNSNYKYSSYATVLGMEIYTPTISSVLGEISATEWSGTYWQYYYQSSSGGYVRNRNPQYSTDTIYYTITYSWQPVTISSYNLYNSFTAYTSGEANEFRNSVETILPNERLSILSFRTTIGSAQMIDGSTTRLVRFKNNVRYLNDASGTEDVGVQFINEGSEFAYIKNFNSNDTAYIVRFTGEIDGEVTNVYTYDGYNYYIGVVRPGQIIRVPMSSADDFKFDFVEINGVYTGDLPIEEMKDWPLPVLDKFDRLYK